MYCGGGEGQRRSSRLFRTALDVPIPRVLVKSPLRKHRKHRGPGPFRLPDSTRTDSWGKVTRGEQGVEFKVPEKKKSKKEERRHVI